MYMSILHLCRVHTCQGNVREIYFFQGQGIVREFCDVSGKNEILQKCQGNVREFYIPDEARMFGPRYIFPAKFIKFPALIFSWKFEFVSGKSQGNVREFWSVLNVWTLLWHVYVIVKIWYYCEAVFEFWVYFSKQTLTLHFIYIMKRVSMAEKNCAKAMLQIGHS